MENIEFNHYSVDNKIQDFMDNLNEDFAKIKFNSGGNNNGGGNGGGVIFADTLPVPTSAYKGIIIYINNPSGMSDGVYICKKIANNSYVWYEIA